LILDGHCLEFTFDRNFEENKYALTCSGNFGQGRWENNLSENM
jgi:hypothetical protein